MAHRAQVPINSVAVIAMMLAVAGCGQEGDTIISSAPAQKQIRVMGQALVTVRPDIARVQLGVQTYAAELDEAVAGNNARTGAVLQALTASGIADRDMRTSAFSVSPQRDYSKEDGSREIVGYWVSNTISVTMRDLDLVGAVLQAAVTAGANNVNGLVFTLEDFGPARQQARIAAVNDAAMRAATLTQAAGATLGAVLTIDEINVGGTSYQRVDMEKDAAASGSVPVAPGELDVSVQVAVVYALD